MSLPQPERTSSGCRVQQVVHVSASPLYVLDLEEGVHHKRNLAASLYCDLQGRKINFTTSKTLVGWCRDGPSRALPLTCPNVKDFEKKKKMKRNASKKTNEMKRK